ncbi:MAG TPA: hypothetical protein DCZ69_11610 [Syntrophobacteraceae bacterium]|jgi:hypothetical protein|nr:hypothetical protein [Syntrophobacteraceae bacterium]
MLEQIVASYKEATLDTDRDRAARIAHEAEMIEMMDASHEDNMFKIVLPAMDLKERSISEH